jgi:hypothetical protein
LKKNNTKEKENEIKLWGMKLKNNFN